jgi:hypothetical protein
MRLSLVLTGMLYTALMWNTSRAGGVTLTNFDASADAETVSVSETANELDAEADVS